MAKKKIHKRGFKKNNTGFWSQRKLQANKVLDVTEISKPQTRRQSNEDSKPDAMNNGYHIFNVSLLNELINSAFKDHQAYDFTCKGQFQFEIKESRLLSSSWCIKCQFCHFYSTTKKLYREQKTNKKGLHPSTLNESLGMALCFSSIGATQFSEIMCALGIFPGTVAKINEQISKASNKLKELAQNNMKEERKKLLDHPRVSISVDGWYNNRIRNTPGQAATQCVFTTVENLSDQGKILDCVIQNKICIKGTKLRNEGKDITCPDDNHKCTATMSNLEPIAQEGKYTLESLRHITEDKVKIGSVTSDGDVKIKNAVLTSLGKDVEIFSDPRHLSTCMKKAIAKYSFSKAMLETKKGSFKQMQRWFADDVKNRLELEFKEAEEIAHQTALSKLDTGSTETLSRAWVFSSLDNTKYDKFRAEKLEEMERLLKDVPDKIIKCMKKKNCGICLVCRTAKDKSRMKFKTKYTGKIKMTKSDEVALKKLMQKRVSTQAIKSTYMKLNTQKNEAFNRLLSKTCPKFSTNTTNLGGRVGAAILVNNKGLEDAHAIVRVSTCHEVSEKIKHEWGVKQSSRSKAALKRKSSKLKVNRFMSMIKSFEDYAKVRKIYKKGIDLPK